MDTPDRGSADLGAGRDALRPPDMNPQSMEFPKGAEASLRSQDPREMDHGGAPWADFDTYGRTAEQAENLREAESILREVGWVKDDLQMCLDCGTVTQARRHPMRPLHRSRPRGARPVKEQRGVPGDGLRPG